MNKRLLFISFIAIFVAFSSCKKKEDKEPVKLLGEYTPDKKINRIYKDYGNGRELREVWNWDDNRIECVDHYYSGSIDWTEYYTYNDKGQIERVDDYQYNEYIEYEYDGSKLNRAAYYSDGSLEEEYMMKYDGNNKIIEVEAYYFDYKKDSKKRLLNEGNCIINKILHKEALLALEKLSEKNASKDTYVANIKAEWEGNNIAKIIITEDDYRYTEEYTYDDKFNPYKNYLNLYFDEIVEDFSLNENNATKVRFTEIEDGETDGGTITYTYTYDSDFPKSRRLNYDGDIVFTYYEYR